MTPTSPPSEHTWSTTAAQGPLAGIRVVELEGQGPGPHAAELLAEWGADLTRVVRPSVGWRDPDSELDAERPTVVYADLKSTADLTVVRKAIERSDVLIEGFRPGVTERLGLGPDSFAESNPALIYARVTGWGQRGPRAQTAGHDINYLSVTGILHAIGETHQPTVPLNLVGDFGAGSMYLVSGILAALLQRARTGRGQVIDAAIVDGVGVISRMIWEFRRMGIWHEYRGSNILDGGAPYYGVYRCSDDTFIAVGAIEQPFYDQFLLGLELDREALPDRDDRTCWPDLREIIGRTVGARTRDEWCAVFNQTDACVTPVLTMSEALEEPHLSYRGAFGEDPVEAPRPTGTNLFKG
jgi:alpha-methylacyl-CoA racemase